MAGPPAGQPSLTLAPAGAAEDAGSLAFAVTLSRASAQTVTVAFASADLTAQAGVDYSEATGTLTFGPATMAATIAVAVNDDELAETEETFELTLSAAWNATLGAGVLALSATGTITDDDAAPAVGSGTALAVDEGQTAIPSGQLSATDADHDTAELSWTIPDGAAGGDDGARFTVSSGGVLSLRAAQDYENPADADSDRVYEVTVRVSDGTNAATADLQVTLQDVLPVVTVAADAASVVEGTAAAFTLTRSGDLSGTQAVTVAVTDSAEVLAAGQTALEQVTFADAAAAVALLVATDDDTVAERGATVTATVQGGGRYTVGTPDQAEVAVLDNDASALLMTVAPSEVAEGAAPTAVVVRAAWAAGARAALTDLTVSVGADGDTATAAADYAPVQPFSLTIAAGAFAGSATFTLAPVADDVDEEGEALTVDAVAAASSVTVSAATLTISDDDERGITVAPNALAVQEGRSADYTVQLTSAPTDQVTVTVSGTAGTDLSVAENTLTFSRTNWNTAQPVTVTAGQDDDAVEDTATLTHTASGGDYGSVSKDLAVTVTDDDTPEPELTLELGEPGHTDDDGSGTINLGDKLTYAATVTNSGNVPLSAVAIRDLLIDTDGKQCGVLAIGESCELSGEYTVTQGDVDAGQVENTATAAAAELSADETASVSTEVDQERGLSLAIEPPSTYVSVGAEIEYRYKVSNSGTVTLTGAVTIADDTVSGITCEVLPEGVLGPGEETTCTGRYRVQQGDVDAGQVANRATATLDGVTTAEATARVRWRADQQRVVPVVTVSATRAAESVGTVELEVRLSVASAQTVTVDYETEDDSAIAGEDYTETSGTLTFGPGATARTIEVVVIDDAEDEQEETFEVTLSGPWNATLSGGQAELTGTATIADDDTRGIAVNPAALGVAEGASASYTVALTSRPTGPVTVTVGGTAGTDLSVTENTLTFSTTSWNMAQPVEVTAGQDDDAVEDTATLTHGASGGDYASVSKALTVTVTDNDTPGLVLSKMSMSVAEGSRATYTVRLATQPTGPVTVTVGGTVGTDLSVTENTLPFSRTSWATAQTVTVSAGEDDDAVHDTATLTHTASGGDYGGVNKPLTVTVTDDDTPGLVLSKSELAVTEGASASYTVQLATQPTGQVTVTVTVGGTSGTDLSVTGNTLTFSTTNWNTAKTVTVSAGQDDDAVEDAAALTHGASGGDYGSVSKDLTVTVTDDDTAGLVLSQATLAVTEGASASYTVKLATQPTGQVTVTVGGTSRTDLSVTENTLTFSRTSWATAQTVTVSAGEDDDASGDSATLTHGASGGDYGSVSKDLPVTVTDNDTPGLVLSKATLAVTEGAGASYTVKLATQPTGQVTVTVGGMTGTDLSVTENTLTFSRTSWATAQTVTVSAGEDDDASGDSATLTHGASGGDYGSVSKDLPVTVTDDDTPGLELSKPELAVTEGASASYTVALTSQPTGQVTVTVSGTAGTDLSVVENTLTFSRTNWNTAQTVTVSAGQDDDAVEDTATLTHGASGGDYNSVTKDLAVTVTDNDTPGLVLSKSELAVTEGASASYTVKLATQPTGQVTVAVGGTAGTDLSVTENTLTFSRTSWSTAQTVTVNAGEDDDAVEDTATLTHTAAGGGYASVTKALPVTVTDDDTAGLVLSKTTLAVTEGASASYTVKLATQPTAEVTVTVAGTAGTDLSVTENTLTFSRTSWATAQTVTVSAGEDDDAVEDTATLTHTAAGGGYASVTKALPVTVTDDDTAGLVLSKTTLAVTEGASASYTVKLATQPTGQVTVTVGGMTDTALSVTENTLTFSRTSWATAQTVTVNAGEDDDASGDSETLTHTAAGGGYASVSKDLPVTVTDNDAPTSALSIVLGDPVHGDEDDSGTVNLGDKLTYTATATNSGNVPLSGVQVSDLLVQSSAVQCGELAVAASCELTGSYAVTQADVDAGETSNTVTAAAAELDDPVTASVTTQVAQERELTLGIAAAPESYTLPGDTISYTYRLSNSGTVTLTGSVSITDDTVSGITCAELTEAGLAPGADTTCTGSYTVVQVDVDAGEVTNSATASLDSETSAAATATVRWETAQSDALLLSVSADPVEEAEANLEFVATLSRANEQTVTVAYETADDTAEAGTDYTSVSGSLTFSPGDTTHTVVVSVHDDAVDEPDERLNLILRDPSHPVLPGDTTLSVPGTIIDDDDQGITVEPTDLTLDAGETGTYEVTLTSQPTGPVTVEPMVTEDDISVAPPQVTFTTEDWDTPQIFTVTVGPDAEFSRRVILHSAHGADYESMEPESVTTRMSRKASPPQLPPSTSVALHVLPARVPEEGGAATVQITATLDGAPRSDVTTVTVAVGSGTAQAGIDFAAVASFTVVIPANETRGAGTFALVPENDTLDEPDETVTVGGTTDAAELTVLGATLTVLDDDDPPRLTIADAEAAEGTREIVFHVRLERASGRQISVVCTSEDGTATAPDDYERERGVLTLEPGQTAASIRLAVMDDTIAEPDETFRIVLSDPSNVELATATATGTILNDDANLSRMWLSRFGRAVATEVLDAVERRLVAAGGESTMSMAGHQVAAAGAEPDNPEPEFAVPTADGEARAMPFSELLAGSAFLVASGDASAAPGGWAGWAGWGRGGAAQFEGSERNASLSGELIGGIGGIDYDWGWLLAGVAVAHNVGRGEFSLPGTPERPARVLSVNSSLTSVHPYVRVAPADGVLLWGLLGYGLGSMDLADREADIGIEMKLAAYGARGAMLTPAATGGFGLDLKSDGFLVLMNTQEPAGEAVVDADASRVRLVLNGSLEVPLGLAGALSPSAEVGVRYDAGDAESGVGVELGGGVRYALPVWGLSVDAGARMLLAHQDRDYREWGARGSIHLDPGTPGRGLTLAVSTSRGAATTATEHLWSVGNAGELMRSDVVPPAGGRVNAEVGYALEVLGSTGVLTPSAELELNDSGGRIYRLGGSLIQGSAVSISMAGARTERPGAEPEYHLTLNTTLRW